MQAIKRLKLFIIIPVVILFVTMGCGKPSAKRYQFLVSPKGLVPSFWLAVKAGADSAGNELGVDIIWNGPVNETDIAVQISIVENYINKNVNAIVLAGCDAKALIPAVEQAHAAKIPVITIDSGIDSDLPESYIGTDNILGAKMGAQALAKLIGGKGEVACIPNVPGAATHILREQGFREGLKDYPDVKLVAVQYCQSDVALAMSITENILTAHPDLAGIFACSGLAGIGCAQALAARGVKGKVKLVAFDSGPNELQAMEAGAIQALVAQNPFMMGYLGVMRAYDVLRGRKVEKRIDTGVAIVTLDNMNEPAIRKILFPQGK